MYYLLKLLFTFFVLLRLNINSNAQNVIPIKINLAIQKINISTYKDFLIQLKITTNDLNIKTPFRKCFIYGYDYKTKTLDVPDAIFELEKIVGKHTTKMNLNSGVSDDSGNLCLDSNAKEMYDTLSFKNALVYTKNICSYYNFKKAKYRARLKLNIPKSAGLKPNFIYTDWVYFNVITLTIDFSDFGK